ncbi:MAG TPA: hypothetical protein VMX94_04695 [Armatimonadota bacterium]|nr:hypothetical protein [Armatimonadota bacterium]
MTSNIKKSIDKLAERADMIMASPATIEKLRRQGLPMQTIPAPTLEQWFEGRKANAKEVVKYLPEPPPIELVSYAIKSLYEEILHCILCGLNGAAITLSGNLIEFTLKHAAFVREAGGYQNYDPEKWDEFEQIDFAHAISRAKRAGLISSKMGKRLHAFREDIRNPYSHYNIRKITREVVAGHVKVLNLETREYEEKDIPAKQDPNIQALAKPIIDKRMVLNVFLFADEVVKYVLKRLGESVKA